MSVNKAILVGRLTKDAELKYLADNNRSVLNFTLAVNRDYSSNSTERETDFIPVSYWTEYAESLQRYLVKGRLVVVTGRLQVSSYETSEGVRRYSTRIVAEDIQFLDSWKSNEVG